MKSNQLRPRFGFDGDGITVVVLDSGINAGHADLAGRVAEAAHVQWTAGGTGSITEPRLPASSPGRTAPPPAQCSGTSRSSTTAETPLSTILLAGAQRPVERDGPASRSWSAHSPTRPSASAPSCDGPQPRGRPGDQRLSRRRQALDRFDRQRCGRRRNRHSRLPRRASLPPARSMTPTSVRSLSAAAPTPARRPTRSRATATAGRWSTSTRPAIARVRRRREAASTTASAERRPRRPTSRAWRPRSWGGKPDLTAASITSALKGTGPILTDPRSGHQPPSHRR